MSMRLAAAEIEPVSAISSRRSALPGPMARAPRTMTRGFNSISALAMTFPSERMRLDDRPRRRSALEAQFRRRLWRHARE
jgi:hypothetical protein